MKRFWLILLLILIIWWLPIEVGGEEVRSHFDRGMGYYKSRQYEEAVGEFGKVLAIDPDHTRALRYLKRSRRKMADALEAKLRAQKRALERARREAEREARRRKREELRQEARELREERLRKKREAAMLREEARAHFKEGKTYYLHGMYQEAIDRLDSALELDPEFTKAAIYKEKALRKME